MEQNIDKIKLKFTGTFELDREMRMDGDYRLILDGSIVKVELGSNQDGTYNKIYKFKPATFEIEE